VTPSATQYRVIYGDTDQMGVVYHANYLRFCEMGRNEFIRQRGLPYREIEARFRIHLPVVEMNVRYQQSARYDDVLRIETTLGELRRVSLRFEYRILRAEDGVLLCTASSTHACISFEGKPVRFPPEVVVLLG
jgi:acyl-CoA thioester hydrolase